MCCVNRSEAGDHIRSQEIPLLLSACCDSSVHVNTGQQSKELNDFLNIDFAVVCTLSTERAAGLKMTRAPYGLVSDQESVCADVAEC